MVLCKGNDRYFVTCLTPNGSRSLASSKVGEWRASSALDPGTPQINPHHPIQSWFD